MFLIRAFVNLLILGVELALIVGVAALGYFQPLWFAGLTFLLALTVGSRLEILRLQNELGFYFDRETHGPAASAPAHASLWLWLVALTEALFKAVLAGVVALVTFSGTDPHRLLWVAIVLAIAIFAGSSVLRWLTNRFDARPGRWGYFRIGVPLGVIFSAAMACLPTPTYAKIGWDLLFNLSARPTLAQGSEMLFLLKQKFDELALALLKIVFAPELAQAISVVMSINMLTGFVAGLYAVFAAETVRALEGRN